jgi:hypothetical protein
MDSAQSEPSSSLTRGTKYETVVKNVLRHFAVILRVYKHVNGRSDIGASIAGAFHLEFLVRAFNGARHVTTNRAKLL